MVFSGQDGLAKALTESAEAVVYVLNATDLVQESMVRVETWPPATVHLGQAMMAAALLQALSEGKENETVSLQWMTDGPFGHLYAEARNFGELRGTIQNPRPNVADYETKLGEGVLQVRRARHVSTTGLVPSVGDVSLDVVEYLERSEQRACGINLSVKIEWEDSAQTKFRVAHALGYLVHVLPQSDGKRAEEALLRWDRQMRSLGSISRWTLRSDQILADMLRLISLEESPNIVLQQRVRFSCHCNAERATRALTMLDAHEGTGTDAAEVKCEYCGKTYQIARK